MPDTRASIWDYVRGFSRPFWAANISELFERIAYYGMAPVLVPYLTQVRGFDQGAAIRWGEMMAEAERRGRPRPAIDLQIAATAGYLSIGLVTRNTVDFEDLGLEIINPWEGP